MAKKGNVLPTAGQGSTGGPGRATGTRTVLNSQDPPSPGPLAVMQWPSQVRRCSACHSLILGLLRCLQPISWPVTVIFHRHRGIPSLPAQAYVSWLPLLLGDHPALPAGPSQLLIKPQECAPGQAPASAQAPLSVSQRTCLPKQALSSGWLLPGTSLRRTHPPGKLATGHQNRFPPSWNRGNSHSHKEEEQDESLPSGQKCPFAFSPLSAVLGMQCVSSGRISELPCTGQAKVADLGGTVTSNFIAISVQCQCETSLAQAARTIRIFNPAP